jgi:hypothetical protein
MRVRVVPELGHEGLALEDSLHEAALNAAAPAVD